MGIRISLILILTLLAGACTPGTPTPDNVPQQLPPEVTNRVLQFLNQRLDQDVQELQVQEVEQVEWPDACLGMPEEDEVCAQVVTPGYRILVEIDDQQYELHTGLEANKIRLQVLNGS